MTTEFTTNMRAEHAALAFVSNGYAMAGLVIPNTWMTALLDAEDGSLPFAHRFEVFRKRLHEEASVHLHEDGAGWRVEVLTPITKPEVRKMETTPQEAITLSLSVPKLAIKHVIDLAWGGSIRYWGVIIPTDATNGSDVHLIVHDKDQGNTHTIRTPDIERALIWLSAHLPPVFARIISDGAEAEDADLLVQVACFGELVYG